MECGPGPVASACFILGPAAGAAPALQPYQGRVQAAIRRRRRMVGTGGNAPPSPRCRRGGFLLTYAPKARPVDIRPVTAYASRRLAAFTSSGSRDIWSGSADLHRAFPVPQTGGTLPCPEPGRSPSGQPRVAYPRFLFGLVVQTDFSPSTVAEEVRGQNLVRCEGDPGILEGAPGSAPGLSGPRPLVLSYHTPPPKIGAPERNRTSV